MWNYFVSLFLKLQHPDTIMSEKDSLASIITLTLHLIRLTLKFDRLAVFYLPILYLMPLR